LVIPVLEVVMKDPFWLGVFVGVAIGVLIVSPVLMLLIKIIS
jgi:hypothetical protein